MGSLGKIEFSKQLFLKDQNFQLLESHRKQYKNIREGHFVERLILRRLAFLDCCHFKTEYSSIFETFAVCYPKLRNMKSLKHHFLKIAYSFFFENLVKDVKLILGKVLRALCVYLQSFLSYRENPARGGGQNLPTTHLAGAV